jgi:hypothetical protein
MLASCSRKRGRARGEGARRPHGQARQRGHRGGRAARAWLRPAGAPVAARGHGR